MNFLDLFSGIGGFALGLERAGHRTVAFCEIDSYCRRVLRKHWPDVPCYDDVRTLTADRLRADGIDVDAICGGFPCQDISVAGKGAGIAGERSGLWSEYARIIGELRPRYAIVENVTAMLGRGLSDVLGDLAALGYDAEWHCIPASAVGAPHRRDRVWIVAYRDGGRQSQFPQCNGQPLAEFNGSFGYDIERCNSDVADAKKLKERPGLCSEQSAILGWGRRFSDSNRAGEWWITKPNVGRMAHGVPARVDRLRSLGNAVVPQIPEIIGRAIMLTCPNNLD